MEPSLHAANLRRIFRDTSLFGSSQFTILDPVTKELVTALTVEQFIEFSSNDKNRRVAETLLDKGRVRVSTVLLPLHGPGLSLPFETMIFGLDRRYDPQVRYPTWRQAMAGHEKAVRYARKFLYEAKRKKPRGITTRRRQGILTITFPPKNRYDF